MIIPKDFQTILQLLSKQISLKEALSLQGIGMFEFFQHLEKNADDRQLFELARQMSVEQCVDDMLGLIDSANNKLELDKASLKIATTKWLAEKIIPKTYGQKLDIKVEKTLDIRGILEEARQRVQSVIIPVITHDAKEVIIDDDQQSANINSPDYTDILD